MTIAESNAIITKFMGERDFYLSYHSSWDCIHPVYRKIPEIGIWMMTNNHEKLWLEKSTEINDAILNGIKPERAAILISELIKWYNKNKTT